MQLEDEMLGEEGLVTPDYPADTGRDQAVLVAGGIDRLDTRKFKVPGIGVRLRTIQSNYLVRKH